MLMRRWICVLSAFLTLFAATEALSAQDRRPDAPGQGSGFTLEQNRPNPFNAETVIPFTLWDDLFVDGTVPRVSIQIFNFIQQQVGTPVALGHVSGDGQRMELLEYTQPGSYQAFWDGTDHLGRQVALGVYYVKMTVNGRTTIKKILKT